MSTPRTFAPSLRRRERGRAVAAAEVEHVEPGVIPIAATSASPLPRMLAAMRVKSPFSHSAWFGFSLVTARSSS